MMVLSHICSLNGLEQPESRSLLQVQSLSYSGVGSELLEGFLPSHSIYVGRLLSQTNRSGVVEIFGFSSLFVDVVTFGMNHIFK